MPPYTDVVSLGFEDFPFEPQRFEDPCEICGSEGVYLDEVIIDDAGGAMFVCSDTDHCERTAAANESARLAAVRTAALHGTDDTESAAGALRGTREEIPA